MSMVAQCHIMFFGDYPGMISDHLAVLSLQITFFFYVLFKEAISLLSVEFPSIPDDL